jgi:prepilin-type N-terminal cleavage/methylation domain-containing protein
MNRRGFTLLEVLLAITFLATLMAFTAQSVIRSSRLKTTLQEEIDRDSKLTNALNLMERDINLAFHYRSMEAEVEKEIKQGSASPTPTPNGSVTPPPTPGGQSQSATPGFNFEPKQYVQLTQFIGAESSLHFTSLSHVRTIKDSPESDQQEVGYYLEGCDKAEGDDSDTGQCLWRRSTPYIDEDVTEGGGSTLLLSGVKELRFRYYGEDKLDWVSSWRTDQGGDDATKDKFPLAVEVTLSIVEKGKESSVSTVVPILFPNNPPPPVDTINPLGGTGGPTMPPPSGGGR